MNIKNDKNVKNVKNTKVATEVVKEKEYTYNGYTHSKQVLIEIGGTYLY